MDKRTRPGGFQNDIAEEVQELPPYYDLTYRTVEEFVAVGKSLC